MQDLIVRALLAPDSVFQHSEAEWDLLIRQGRRSNLLAQLAYLLTEKCLIDRVHEAPRQHLVSALRMAERQDIAMRFEVSCIESALNNVQAPVILLKGAAYLIAGLPGAHGRMFSDVDILVPKNSLAEVESELELHGWHGSHHDEYDQRYYRRWMHEIPPMRHVKRGTTIDVHHTILPETARFKVDTKALIGAVVALSNEANLYVLNPCDMLLHSATHLFHEGGLENGLRDLFDLDGLMRHFGKETEFWPALVPRAQRLGVIRPLYYALRYTTLILGTPVPSSVLAAARVGKPPVGVMQIMDYFYLRALRPAHKSCDTAGTKFARFALYVRSHWIRMPMPLLAYHLTRKFLKRENHAMQAQKTA